MRGSEAEDSEAEDSKKFSISFMCYWGVAQVPSEARPGEARGVLCVGKARPDLPGPKPGQARSQPLQYPDFAQFAFPKMNTFLKPGQTHINYWGAAVIGAQD